MSDHPLLAQLKTRKRAVHVFDVSGLVGLGGADVPRVAVWVARKREQDNAVDDATRHAQKAAKNASSDPDVVLDAKAAAIIATCVRDVEQPEKMPVFPSAAEVCEWLTPDQIGALLNLVNQVRRLESPDPDELNMDSVLALARTCAATDATDFPETLLARVSRVKLEQAFVLLAREWLDAASPAEPPTEAA